MLHAAVSYVDLYLLRRKSNRGELQLLGIGCMLIASRFAESFANLPCRPVVKVHMQTLGTLYICDI